MGANVPTASGHSHWTESAELEVVSTLRKSTTPGVPAEMGRSLGRGQLVKAKEAAKFHDNFTLM